MNFSKQNLYILGAIAASVFILMLWLLPKWQGNNYRAQLNSFQRDRLTTQEIMTFEKNAADIENSARVTLAQIIGGLALLTGLYFTYLNVKTAQDNLRVTEEGKLTDRFSKAVELLGSDKLDVRLGGIYALERIARDSQKDHWTVMEVLTAFIREKSPAKLAKDLSEEQIISFENEEPLEDIQAVMTVIGRRNWVEKETQKLNLKGIFLVNCNLIKTNFNKTDFTDSILAFVDLRQAKLNKVSIVKANLIFCDFSNSELQGSILWGANLKNSPELTLEQLKTTRDANSAQIPTHLVKEFREWHKKQVAENLDKLLTDT